MLLITPLDALPIAIGVSNLPIAIGVSNLHTVFSGLTPLI